MKQTKLAVVSALFVSASIGLASAEVPSDMFEIKGSVDIGNLRAVRALLISGADEGFENWSNGRHPDGIDRAAISAELQDRARWLKDVSEDSEKAYLRDLCEEGPVHLGLGDFDEFIEMKHWHLQRILTMVTQDALNALSWEAYNFFASEARGISMGGGGSNDTRHSDPQRLIDVACDSIKSGEGEQWPIRLNIDAPRVKGGGRSR